MKQDKEVSKTSIIIAWIILILALFFSLVITYLKFFGPNKNLEEYPVKAGNVMTQNMDIQQLDLIVTNFNNSELLKEYQKQNIDIKASLKDNNIIVSYEDSTATMEYELIYNDSNLEITIKDEEKNYFDKIYKLLIIANQEALGNKEKYDEYIDEFLINSRKIDGLIIENKENNIIYIMDISKVITLDNDESSEIENNIEGSD